MTEMEPDRKTAERAIREAYESNPGGWAEHSRYVAVKGYPVKKLMSWGCCMILDGMPE